MNFNLIMSMTGKGSCLCDQGCIPPKSLIAISGEPVFVRVLESFDLDFDNHIFITSKKHNITARIYGYKK